ncbi:hypothetical protein Acsp06_50360 [Actinomycetospora sp. NBRC 106375]|uniref:hypothetical protein n=1 Tax=Actinomycetospora sp. NBRC 106375 TaxID=3032207 RepID=UPI0024A2BF8D|nr:hypothetical protein [Actinomycetospora sp. NBRC 106375]GLZ48851.1 hypothetical protein Acsp06_50360 [Actinomycetospora sp. NBRC 106375]
MRSDRGAVTPLGAVARGLAAGAAGTLAMDLYWFALYRHGGGTSGFRSWDLSAGLESWGEAPAPAQVGRRLVEGLFRRELPERRAALVNNLIHWGYGTVTGAQYGLLAGSVRTPRTWFGVPFGSGVWGLSYTVLPPTGLYEPIWRYDRRTLARDLGAHLVYGLGTAAAFRLLAAAAVRT